MTAQLEPDVVAAARGHDREAIRDAGRRDDLVLDGAEFVEGLPQIGRKDLRDHAHDRVGREHARGQFHLTPGERSAVSVHR